MRLIMVQKLILQTNGTGRVGTKSAYSSWIVSSTTTGMVCETSRICNDIGETTDCCSAVPTSESQLVCGMNTTCGPAKWEPNQLPRCLTAKQWGDNNSLSKTYYSPLIHSFNPYKSCCLHIVVVACSTNTWGQSRVVFGVLILSDNIYQYNKHYRELPWIKWSIEWKRMSMVLLLKVSKASRLYLCRNILVTIQMPTSEIF